MDHDSEPQVFNSLGMQIPKVIPSALESTEFCRQFSTLPTQQSPILVQYIQSCTVPIVLAQTSCFGAREAPSMFYKLTLEVMGPSKTRVPTQTPSRTKPKFKGMKSRRNKMRREPPGPPASPTSTKETPSNDDIISMFEVPRMRAFQPGSTFYPIDQPERGSVAWTPCSE